MTPLCAGGDTRRLWSLRDMLSEYALNYIELGTDIEKIKELFANAFNNGKE